MGQSTTPRQRELFAVFLLALFPACNALNPRLDEDTWWHLAVVNDGRHTTLYVQGCPVVRNPKAPAVGITSVGEPWLLGGYTYADKIDQIFYGRLGDVRIVSRALPVSSFMTH